MSDTEVPTESLAPEAEEKPKQKRKEVTFARPVFAQEMMTEEYRKKFDELPSWQRHLIKRVVEHGDLQRAAQEAGVSTYAGQNIDFKKADEKSIDQAMEDHGITKQLFMTHLLDCLDAQVVAFDKHRNPVKLVDMKLKLETLRLIASMRGWLTPQKKGKETDTKGIEQLFEDTPVG